jgi:thiamine pyrophosphate-dependent acetolactate synthase large subunit-like protein
MAGRSGHKAILEQFVADGLTHIFGNPGTVEQGFLDAMSEVPELRYILTLQETVAVMAADAHARATRRPTVVQIHSTPGLGNSIGALYQAMRGRSPLVVIGGDAGLAYMNMDAQMAGDLVGMAKPVTKWSTMVMHPASLLRTLRRAIKIAATPPMGPVYVCLPQDMLDAKAVEPVVPTLIPDSGVLPSADFVAAAAELLMKAERPRIFVGDGIAWDGAQKALVRLAEALGAPVWGVDAGDENMPPAHPLWAGQTGHMFGFQSKPITEGGDVNLVAGTYMLPEVFPELGTIFAAGSKTIHVDLVADNIAKNHPADLGVVASPRLTLAAIADAVDARLDAGRKAAVAAALKDAAAKKQGAAEAVLAKDAALGGTPLKFAQFMRALGPRIPADALIFDEALTSSPELTRHLPPLRENSFFQVRGGSLGTAMAGGIGLAVADRNRPVFAFSGDGGGMYTIQAIWSAARHDLRVIFVVCSNRSYKLLQLNLHQFRLERGITDHAYPLSFDLSKPELGFVAMAAGMGVPGVKVVNEADIGPAVDAALAARGPFLIDVALSGDVHPELIGVACGH